MARTVYNGIPVVPLRGLVVLPGELLHFDAGRDKSVRAVMAAAQKDGLVFLSSQTDVKKNEITLEDIYGTGALCRVRQTLAMPGESLRVLVQGLERARVIELSDGEHLTADIETFDEVAYVPNVAEALRRRVVRSLREYAQLSGRLTNDTIEAISSVSEAGAFADAVANACVSQTEYRQRVLECISPVDRLKLVLSFLSGETDILRIDRAISQEVKKRIDKNQRDYFLHEQMKVIKNELGESELSEADEFTERMKGKQLPDAIRARLEKDIARYSAMPQGSHETPSMRSYIECMLDLPWTETSEDRFDLTEARRILDDEHFGLEKVKERILEYIAVSKLTGKPSGQILCFVGPPGVGKTSISESIAHALNRSFVRMSLGGIHDEAEIRGHRRTYIGAMPGRVISAMRKAGTVNPVMLFDEIDKLTNDMRGDPSAAMLEVLDSAQNFAFRDHFLEVPYDLSKVMFITTANSTDTIPRPLLDRMEIIEVPSYLEIEKREIAKHHLLKKQLEKHGLKKSNVVITDAIMTQLIRDYTREAGVRELERKLAGVCRKAACEVSEGKTRIRLTKQKLIEYLGQPKYTNSLVEKEDMVGVVNGLAWTQVGGETLEVEAQVMVGTGQLQLTGQLGDVMQESAKAALTYVRAHADAFGIDPHMETRDIHIHVPEGAVPKDGPSAGVTMVTALVSALTDNPVRANVAMTGEITLRGRVLPIGGLREKLLAAVRAGMTCVVIPDKNRKDLEEVPEEVRSALDIVFASDVMTVLKTALVNKIEPKRGEVKPIVGIEGALREEGRPPMYSKCCERNVNERVCDKKGSV